MNQLVPVAVLQSQYPDEWVLLGDSVMDEHRLDVVAGVPLFHSKDK